MQTAMLRPGAGSVMLLLAAIVLWTLAGQAGAQLAGGDFNLSGDGPVQVDGDRLEVLEDQGLAIFEGNVRVVQGDTVLRTGRLVIHYVRSEGANAGAMSSASQIDRLEASNGVNIQSGNRVATGEAGTYDMGTEVLTLTGERVTLSEDGNVATGCRLTVDMRSSRSTLEGCADAASRPTILIQPQNR